MIKNILKKLYDSKVYNQIKEVLLYIYTSGFFTRLMEILHFFSLILLGIGYVIWYILRGLLFLFVVFFSMFSLPIWFFIWLFSGKFKPFFLEDIIVEKTSLFNGMYETRN